jgi:hypothetical protein
VFEFRFDSATRTKLIAKLHGMSPRLVSVLGSKLRALMFQLQAKIVSEKLSGQVLHRRTGILAGTVHTLPVTTAGNTISGGVAAASGPALYGKYHEVGGSQAYKIMSVKSRALAFTLNGKQVYAKSVIRPPLRQRAFMRPSLLESAQTIHDELQRAIDQEFGR